jgi:hypothetical protein
MLRDGSLQQQEMDYCMVALPYASAFRPMLHLFTRVICRSNHELQRRDDDPFSSNKTSIYLLHRNGLSPVHISTQHLIALTCHRLWIDSCCTISCLNPWRYIPDFSERIWKCKLIGNVNYYRLCSPAINWFNSHTATNAYVHHGFEVRRSKSIDAVGLAELLEAFLDESALVDLVLKPYKGCNTHSSIIVLCVHDNQVL